MSKSWAISNLMPGAQNNRKFEFVLLSAAAMPTHWVPELFPVDEYLLPGIDDALRSKLLKLRQNQKMWRTGVPWSTTEILALYMSDKAPESEESEFDQFEDDNSETEDLGRITIPCPPMVNVMLIGWNGDIAHRLGIGKILLSGWKQAEPKVKTIVVE